VFLAVQTDSAFFSVPNTYCFHSIGNLKPSLPQGIIILVLRVLRIPQNGVTLDKINWRSVKIIFVHLHDHICFAVSVLFSVPVMNVMIMTFTRGKYQNMQSGRIDGQNAYADWLNDFPLSAFRECSGFM